MLHLSLGPGAKRKDGGSDSLVYHHTSLVAFNCIFAFIYFIVKLSFCLAPLVHRMELSGANEAV